MIPLIVGAGIALAIVTAIITWVCIRDPKDNEPSESEFEGINFTGRRRWKPAVDITAPATRISADETLVVIDAMKSYLESLTYDAGKKLLEAIWREIDEAISVGAFILLVVYPDNNGNGDPTHESIRRRLDNYDPARWTEIKKFDMGGAKEVDKACDDLKFSKKLRACGIYTEQCVFHTVWGLSQKAGYTVDLVVDACCAGKSKYNWKPYLNPKVAVRLVRQVASAPAEEISAA